MHHLVYIFFALGVIICSAVSSAQAVEKVSIFDKFRLWNECKPISILVEFLPDRAEEIGLTKEAIEVAVRSRLRGARIFAASPNYLYINVNLIGSAFSTRLSFNKWLRDTDLGEGGMAETWDTGSVGTHGNNASYILGSISKYTDKFIEEYLRVNADACK